MLTFTPAIAHSHAFAAHCVQVLGNLCNFVGVADSVEAPHRRAGAAAALRANAASGSASLGSAAVVAWDAVGASPAVSASFLRPALIAAGYAVGACGRPAKATAKASTGCGGRSDGTFEAQSVQPPPSFFDRHPLVAERILAPLRAAAAEAEMAGFLEGGGCDTSIGSGGRDRGGGGADTQEVLTALHLLPILCPALGASSRSRRDIRRLVTGHVGTEGRSDTARIDASDASRASGATTASLVASASGASGAGIVRVVVLLALEAASPVLRDVAATAAAALVLHCGRGGGGDGRSAGNTRDDKSSSSDGGGGGDDDGDESGAMAAVGELLAASTCERADEDDGGDIDDMIDSVFDGEGDDAAARAASSSGRGVFSVGARRLSLAERRHSALVLLARLVTAHTNQFRLVSFFSRSPPMMCDFRATYGSPLSIPHRPLTR